MKRQLLMVAESCEGGCERDSVMISGRGSCCPVISSVIMCCALRNLIDISIAKAALRFRAVRPRLCRQHNVFYNTPGRSL